MKYSFCSEKGYIYLLQECHPNGDPTGFYKVGRSGNTKHRLEDLQTGNPRLLKEIARTCNKVALRRETMAHDYLNQKQGIEHTSDKYQGGTEWYIFKGGPEEMIDIFEAAVRVKIIVS